MNGVVALQGLWVKTVTRRLPEPAGEPSGSVPGTLPALRIAVTGESTAAGCGVGRHDEGFAAAFAREVAARTGQAVDWTATGRYGATAVQIRQDLLPTETDLNMVVVLAGVNDVLTRRRPEQWREDLSALVGDLAGRTTRIVVTGIPPFTLFPALPSRLAHYLADRAALLDNVSTQVCRGRAMFVRSEFDEVPDGFFAADSFHPSAAGYRQWAAMVAAEVHGEAFRYGRRTV
ncbi:SGNH/GDSL hydrolase family protein [Actinoplanes couchii]|uniref:SGNH hydrolase-type esterase domain-containing protein n=1 Tax=Actinoplanes couchii TaxID=403638 RepID=A0ABQ3XGD2_9ACTN|nr:SGNH/GDSL hydrolase family protein [Actinoplanes couchii]MDR6321039.1 lysophospholipase L1-like esterase [Actinoplanes couchii]GID57550.1 hypothetical protein Aco03nite_059540 [Actinoplanes couchii]